MKKIILISLLLLMIVGCSPKKEEYYNLTFEDITIAVGFDQVDILSELHVNSYTTHFNKKEEEIVDYIEVYVNDLSSKDIYLNDYKLESIKNTCGNLNGELVSNNGNACVLHNYLKDTENVVILYGNILNDNSDEIDRIEVSYIQKED